MKKEKNMPNLLMGDAFSANRAETESLGSISGSLRERINLIFAEGVGRLDDWSS